MIALEIADAYMSYLLKGDPAPHQFFCPSCQGLLLTPMKYVAYLYLMRFILTELQSQLQTFHLYA